MTREETLFELIPAVDILGAEAVRLVQGDYDEVALREPDPFSLIAKVVSAGAGLVHVVDLTAARSGRVRPEIFQRAAASAGDARVQASGGVRSVVDAEQLLGAGAARVLVGTAAFGDDTLLKQLVDRLGDQLVVAVDVRDGLVRVDGWTRDSGLAVDAAVERCLDAGVSRLLCTAIERDGTLGGPALELLASVCALSGLPVLAAGGVRSLEDVGAIEAVGCEGAIVGRAVLEGRVPLSALRALPA